MPFDALKFVHAAGLQLDRPLEFAGPVPDSLRETLEDACISAFEHLISTCIEREVDFLLLTGNSFDESEKCLRARVALQKGFHRLAEEGIRAFIMPGELDPPDAWRELPRLPDNVSLFLHRTEEPVAVIRNVKVIAAISHLMWNESAPACSTPDQNTQSKVQGEEKRIRPFQIGISLPFSDSASALLEFGNPATLETDEETSSRIDSFLDRIPELLDSATVDFLALGGGLDRLTIEGDSATAHHPGSIQGYNSQQTGLHGCTLIEVDANGQMQTEFVPTSVVRWERFPLEVEPETDTEQLLETMLEAISNVPQSPTENVRIIHWQITGTGPLFESLQQKDLQDNLIEQLAEFFDGENQPSMIHSLCPLPGSTEAIPEHSKGDDLLEEFLESLEAGRPISLEMVTELMNETGLPDQKWATRLRSLRKNCDLAAVGEHAERLGGSWFSEKSHREDLP